MHEAGWSEEDEERLFCSKCGGTLPIAEEVATVTSNIPWTAEDLDMVKEAMKANREVHDLQIEENAKKKKKPGTKPEPKRKTETFIHQCFGHDQDAIEGFRDCDEGLQKALGQERVERNAATESEGAVKTEKVVDTRKGNDAEGDKPEERINPDSQEADDEDEDHFEGPEFNDMDALLRKRAKGVHHKPKKATITLIPVSLPERGELVVATAVKNDVRPESHLAAHDTTGIHKDKDGNAYGVKGASGPISLLRAIGPP